RQSRAGGEGRGMVCGGPPPIGAPPHLANGTRFAGLRLMRRSTLSNTEAKRFPPSGRAPFRECRRSSNALPFPETLMTSLKLPLVVVARLLLAAMFILSGASKLGDIAGTAGFIASAGLPAPAFLAVAAGLLELVAGLA